MKGNKMPIKITPIKKKKKSKVDPDQKKFQESLKNFKNPKPKKMQKGGKTTQKKLDQAAKYRASVAYQTKNAPKTKGMDYLKDLPGTLSKDISQVKKIRKRALQVAAGDPIAEKKYGTGKRTGFNKADKYFPPSTDGSVEKPLKSYKRDKNSPNKSGFRVTKKKSGGVIKANMGKLLETFSPAYSMMKGKGPVSSILSAVGGSGLGGPASIFAKQQRDKAKKRRMEMSGEKENTNRMTPATPAAGMKKGGSLKKKKSIDGIASKGKTRGV